MSAIVEVDSLRVALDEEQARAAQLERELKEMENTYSSASTQLRSLTERESSLATEVELLRNKAQQIEWNRDKVSLLSFL